MPAIRTSAPTRSRWATRTDRRLPPWRLARPGGWSPTSRSRPSPAGNAATGRSASAGTARQPLADVVRPTRLATSASDESQHSAGVRTAGSRREPPPCSDKPPWLRATAGRRPDAPRLPASGVCVCERACRSGDCRQQAQHSPAPGCPCSARSCCSVRPLQQAGVERMRKARADDGHTKQVCLSRIYLQPCQPFALAGDRRRPADAAMLGCTQSRFASVARPTARRRACACII